MSETSQPPAVLKGWLRKERVGIGASFKKPKAVYVSLEKGIFKVYESVQRQQNPSSQAETQTPDHTNLRAEYDLSRTNIRVDAAQPCRLYLDREDMCRYFEADSPATAKRWEEAIQQHIDFAQKEWNESTSAHLLDESPRSSRASSEKDSPIKADPDEGALATSILRDGETAKRRHSLESSFKHEEKIITESHAPPPSIQVNPMSADSHNLTRAASEGSSAMLAIGSQSNTKITTRAPLQRSNSANSAFKITGRRKPFSPFDFDGDDEGDGDDDIAEKNADPRVASASSARANRNTNPKLTGFVMPTQEERLSDEGYAIVPIPGFVIQTVSKKSCVDSNHLNDINKDEMEEVHSPGKENVVNVNGATSTDADTERTSKVFINLCTPGFVVKSKRPVDVSVVNICEKSNIGEAPIENGSYEDLKGNPKWPNMICSPCREEPERDGSKSIIFKNDNVNVASNVSVYDVIVHPSLIQSVTDGDSHELRDLLCERLLERIEANYDEVLDKNYVLPKMFKRYKGTIRTAFVPFKSMGNTLLIRKPSGFDEHKTFTGQKKKRNRQKKVGMDFACDDGNAASPVDKRRASLTGSVLENILEEDEDDDRDGDVQVPAVGEPSPAPYVGLEYPDYTAAPYCTPDSHVGIWKDCLSDGPSPTQSAVAPSCVGSAIESTYAESLYADSTYTESVYPDSTCAESSVSLGPRANTDGRRTSLGSVGCMSDVASVVSNRVRESEKKKMRFPYQVLQKEGIHIRKTMQVISLPGSEKDKLYCGATFIATRRAKRDGKYWLKTSQGWVLEGTLAEGGEYNRHVALTKPQSGPRSKGLKIISTSFRAIDPAQVMPSGMGWASGLVSLFGKETFGIDDHDLAFTLKLAYPLGVTKILKRSLRELHHLNAAITASKCATLTRAKSVSFPTTEHSIRDFMTDAVDEMLEYVKRVEKWLNQVVRTVDPKTCNCKEYCMFLQATDDDLKEVELILTSQATKN